MLIDLSTTQAIYLFVCSLSRRKIVVQKAEAAVLHGVITSLSGVYSSFLHIDTSTSKPHVRGQVAACADELLSRAWRGCDLRVVTS